MVAVPTALPEQRDRLVESHIDLAYSIARRFIGRGEELDDLRQVAMLALVHAANRFDPSRGFTFSTFAMPTITGALKRHFRDHGWAVRPPRSLQERYLEVNAVTEHLTGELDRFPTVGEIAAHGGWSEAEVYEARAQSEVRYLDHWDTTDEDSAFREPSAVDAGYDRVESRHVIDDLLAGLDDRERHIVELRFYDELGQADIARQVGLSQMHVCRLIKASISAVQSSATATAVSA
jgi:RNA polymerase sigma-B factor